MAYMFTIIPIFMILMYVHSITPEEYEQQKALQAIIPETIVNQIQNTATTPNYDPDTLLIPSIEK
jgi:hypothetical protein